MPSLKRRNKIIKRRNKEKREEEENAMKIHIIYRFMKDEN
jgi:hypothetical protein